MSRSVSWPSSAAVAFSHIEIDSQDDYSHEFEFLVQDFVERCASMWPSMTPCNEWIGREDRAVAENSHVYAGISEYCGVIAYWLAPKDDGLSGGALRFHWLDQVAERFIGAFASMDRIGTFSNGEAVYKVRA